LRFQPEESGTSFTGAAIRPEGFDRGSPRPVRRSEGRIAASEEAVGGAEAGAGGRVDLRDTAALAGAAIARAEAADADAAPAQAAERARPAVVLRRTDLADVRAAGDAAFGRAGAVDDVTALAIAAARDGVEHVARLRGRAAAPARRRSVHEHAGAAADRAVDAGVRLGRAADAAAGAAAIGGGEAGETGRAVGHGLARCVHGERPGGRLAA